MGNDHKPFELRVTLKLIFAFAYERFQEKYLQPPTWGGKHSRGLQVFLERSPQVTLEEWKRRYLAFLASTDRFFQSQKGSLAIFVGFFDSFIDGPVSDRGTHGKLKGTELALQNRAALFGNRNPN